MHVHLKVCRTIQIDILYGLLLLSITYLHVREQLTVMLYTFPM